MRINFEAYSIPSLTETRDRALNFSREVGFMRQFPIAFLAASVFIVTRARFALITSVMSPHVQPIFFSCLVGYVEERLWWPIQSPNKGRKNAPGHHGGVTSKLIFSLKLLDKMKEALKGYKNSLMLIPISNGDHLRESFNTDRW